MSQPLPEPGCFPGGANGKKSARSAGDPRTWVQSLGQEDPLKEEMVTCSGILAWRIPWMELPGGLPSMGSRTPRAKGRVPHQFLQHTIMRTCSGHSLLELLN